jgi:hypothetical protein
MAGAEYIQLIQEGIEAWNEWRLRHTREIVDSSDMDFEAFLVETPRSFEQICETQTLRILISRGLIFTDQT